MNNKNFIIIAILLVLAALVSFNYYTSPRSDVGLKVKVSDFPTQIGEWRSTDLAIDEQTYQILGTRNLFIRDYKNLSGDSVALYIVYSEDNRKVSHSPEVCLRGGGSDITSSAVIQLTDSIKANKLVVEKGNNQDLVVYWFRAKNLNTSQYLKQQFHIALDRMLGKRTSGALIRISTEVKDKNLDAALSLIKSFSAEIEPLFSKYIP